MERSRRIVPLLPVAAAVVSICCGATGCDNDSDERTVPNLGDPMTTPTMTTSDVDSWISDSGYVKYHVTAPKWDMYEDLADPFWKFPEGLNIESYDPQRRPAGDIVCDSAIYYHQRKLARLDGNVVAVNVSRDTFLTRQLYWDQDKTVFYTDSFIHIVKSDRIIEGYGFSSNERMTEYRIHRPTAILPVSALRGERVDSGRPTAVTDSATAAPASFDPDARTRLMPVPASERNRDNDDRRSGGTPIQTATGEAATTLKIQ